MKIALVLVGNSNLGNNLTNYALYSLIKKLCPYDEVTAINVPKEYYSFYFGCDLFCLFKNKPDFNICNVINEDALLKLGDEFDLYICGSDQIWRLGFAVLTNNYPYMKWVRINKRKISFATSFGVDHYEGTRDDTWIASKFLERFDHISVRESSGKNIINTTFNINRDVECVLDPVLLLDNNLLENWADNSKYPISSDYIAAYLWDKENENVVDRISSKTNIANCMILPVKVMMHYKIQSDSNEEGVEDWLKIIKYSELFLTDSFHGVCAAIALKKEFFFINIDNPRGFTRIYDLLKKLDLTDRIIKNISDVTEKKIDYVRVNKILAKYQQSSIEWLNNAIHNNSDIDITSVDQLFVKMCDEQKLAQEFNNQRFKSLFEWIRGQYNISSEVVVWGVSDILIRNFKEIKFQLGVTKVYDNDRDKWGKNIWGFTCTDPEQMNRTDIVLILLESVKYNYEIEKQLIEKGITNIVSYNTILNKIGRI